ncbi:MAG: Gfo/Idh/MocA family oxidoreductase [Myxococcota bacterium]
MRVGILGTGWGRTHVGTFRAAGCTIAAIVGRDPARSAAIARAEGIPGSTPDALEDVGLVVVATPIADHPASVAAHWDRPVFCEKPLVGRPPEPGFSEAVSRRLVGVNYAFPFLDAARRLVRPAEAVRVRVEAGIGGDWALREVAVHPLSWVQHAFGRLSRDGDGLVVAGVVPVSLDVRPRADGIVVAIDLLPHGSLRGVLTDGRWRFTVDGEEAGGSDPWGDANRASAAAFVDRVTTGRQVPGACDAAAALAIDRILPVSPLRTG